MGAAVATRAWAHLRGEAVRVDKPAGAFEIHIFEGTRQTATTWAATKRDAVRTLRHWWRIFRKTSKGPKVIGWDGETWVTGRVSVPGDACACGLPNHHEGYCAGSGFFATYPGASAEATP